MPILFLIGSDFMTDTDNLKSQCKVLVNLHFFFPEKVTESMQNSHKFCAESSIFGTEFWHPQSCVYGFLAVVVLLSFRWYKLDEN